MDNSWMAQGACRGQDPSTFFPSRTEPEKVKQAKAVCAGCPVKDSCLEWALYYNERDGVWGGVSARKRRLMRREAITESRALILCGECGKEFVGAPQSTLCSEECRDVRRKESRRKYSQRKSVVA